MHYLKTVAMIGLSVAAVMVAADHFPTQSNTHMIFFYALVPGLIGSAIFALSSDASLSNGIMAWAIAWAVNTTFYFVVWRIALIAKRKIRPGPRKQTST
jgi:hypothetical protein